MIVRYFKYSLRKGSINRSLVIWGLSIFILTALSTNIYPQFISTTEALNRAPDHITIVSGVTFADNSGLYEQTYDAHDWATESSNIYPLKVGNNKPGTRQVWVGGEIRGPQSRTIQWDDMKGEYDGAGILMNSQDYLVIDGIRTDNVMDAVRPRGNLSRFRLSNAWATYTRDDAIENDNMMGGIIEDCLFDGCFMFLSQQGTLTWSTTDSLEVAYTLVRLQAMPYDTNVKGNPPSFESTYGKNADRHGQLFKHHGPGDAPLIVHDCLFYVPQHSVNGSNSMDFPNFEGCKYSNNILLWTGSGSYPGKLPASGVTEYNLTNSTQEEIDLIWENAFDDWISRHGYDVKPYQLAIGNGSGDGQYILGTEVSIRADAPTPGKIFDKWVGDVDYVLDQFDSITIVTMPMENVSINAVYSDIQYHLTVTNGSGDGLYSMGTDVTIQADESDIGEIFERWIGDIENVQDQFDSLTTISMPMTDISLSATYKIIASESISRQSEKILIFPNPANERVTFTNIPENGELKITKHTGVVIKSFMPTSDRFEWVVGNMEKGIYFVGIRTKGKSQTSKLIII